MAKVKFSIDDLKKVSDLYKRKIQIENWQKEIQDKIEVLERQKVKSQEELAEVMALLDGDYKELAEAAKEFAETNSTTKPEGQRLTIYNPNYVTTEDKEKLLATILEDFKAENPEATAMSFQQVKAVLQSRYDIETRTIGNFFSRQLKEYETTGGNKKKLIVLK
ncbi:hypothetical protein N9B38_00335 [bacterium]|nr:hypothetical protein [bacterium]